MSQSITEFICKHDTEHKVRNAIIDVLATNLTKDITLDIIAEDLQKHLYEYIDSNDDLEIDNGDNIRRDFTNEIKHILGKYFDPSHQKFDTFYESTKHFEKCITVPRWHLTPETFNEYIDNPIRELPWDIYLGCITDNKYVLQINTTTEIEPNKYNNGTHNIPKDLLALLNWAIRRNISMLLLSNDDAYDSWEELQEAAQITGLPLYDITEEDF